jgi:hypothetical protein
VQPEVSGKLIKIIHLIGYRTRDLPACSIVLNHVSNSIPSAPFYLLGPKIERWEPARFDSKQMKMFHLQIPKFLGETAKKMVQHPTSEDVTSTFTVKYFLHFRNKTICSICFLILSIQAPEKFIFSIFHTKHMQKDSTKQKTNSVAASELYRLIDRHL